MRHQAAIVYVGVVLLAVGVAASTSTSGHNATTQVISSQLSEPPNVSATVVKVIDAMAGVQNETAIPMPDHHHDRAQRIVARKGVSNDAAPSQQQLPRTVNGSAANVSTDGTPTSAPISVPNASSINANVSSVKPSPTVASSSAAAPAVTASTQSKSPGSANATATTLRPPTTSSNSSSSSSSSSSSGSTSSTSTTTSTTTSTSTSTTSTTTTTTTTKPPKKPKITYSVEDEPKLLQAAKPGYGSPYDPIDSSGRLRVDEPLAQFSKEYLPGDVGGGLTPPNSRREYIVPIVTLIFAIPLLLGLFLLSYRRAKEFWLTRHYRRMDFLIDGMYNY